MKITCEKIIHVLKLRSLLFGHCTEQSGRLAKL